MIFYTLGMLSYISYVALWTLVLVFGIWTYRRLKLRSLPWLGAYAVLSLVLGCFKPMITRQVVDGMVSQYVPPFGWSFGQFMATWHYADSFIAGVTKLLLGILILSDIAFLLSKVGVEVEGSFLNRFLAMRERSISLGIAMIVFMLSGPAITLALYIHYA